MKTKTSRVLSLLLAAVMLLGVLSTAVLAEEPNYAITVEESENGKVTADKTAAAEGEAVNLVVEAAAGYELSVLSVTDKENKLVEALGCEGVFDFTMPASDVSIKATFVESSGFTVTVEESENGKVTANKTAAIAGEAVNLVVEPAAGYELDVLTVLDMEDKPVELLGSEDVFDFTMPASDVSVKVTFVKSDGFTVTVEESENGKVTANKTAAAAGEAVNLVVEAAAGYELKVLTVVDNEGKPLELLGSEGVFDFTMPASHVRVSAVFMKEITVDNAFIDVAANDYYYDAVLWAVANGVTTGTSATTFSPKEPCTRAQVVTFLYRAVKNAGYDVSSGEDTNILSYEDAFDVPEYAMAAAQWACAEGILTGSNGNLMPNDTCTRAQIVAFLYRTAKAIGVDVSSGEDTNILSYNDAFDIPQYAMGAMQWACAEDILTGSNGNLMPNNDCIRAQVVTFLYRFLGE